MNQLYLFGIAQWKAAKWVIRLGQTVNGRSNLAESSPANIQQVEKGLDEVKSFKTNSRLQINISDMHKPCSYL